MSVDVALSLRVHGSFRCTCHSQGLILFSPGLSQKQLQQGKQGKAQACETGDKNTLTGIQFHGWLHLPTTFQFKMQDAWIFFSFCFLRQGFSGIYSVDQASLKLRDPPASAC